MVELPFSWDRWMLRKSVLMIRAWKVGGVGEVEERRGRE